MASQKPASRPQSSSRAFPTTRLQRSGFRFQVQRQEQAFIRRDVRGLPSPFAQQTSAVSVALVLTVTGCVIMLILSILKPRPDRGMNDIILTQSGGKYVMFDGALHPYTNLASARLIVGSPNRASVVRDSALEGIPRGPLMGIPSAPDIMDAHTDDPPVWTLCDQREAKVNLSLTTSSKVSTTIIAGRDMLDPDAHVLDDKQAVLVRSLTAPDVLWLVFNGHRAEVGPQDFATHAALGLTRAKIDEAIFLSGPTVDAIDILPTLTIPFLHDRGRQSIAIPDHVIGDILTTGDAEGARVHYVVADGGVQKLTPLVASLLVNTGSRQQVEPNPEIINVMPQVQVIDVKRYPSVIPEILTPTTLCYTWERGRDDALARTKITTGDALPLLPDKTQYVNALAVPDRGVVQANKYAMVPGKGWYTRVTGSVATSVNAEQLLYIDDTGTRYFISPDSSGAYAPVLKALGLDIQMPMYIPWSIAKLYIQGSTLSIEGAMVQHAFIPPNLHGIPEPAKDGRLEAPPH